MTEKLFTPFKTGALDLQNRLVIAPMTRRRAENANLEPNDLMVEYYGQRASAGLIITEGSQVSPDGYGYMYTPGCYSESQMKGWKKVTEGVHALGGKIFLQIWHVGALSHPLLQPGNNLPLSASAITPQGEVLTPEGHKRYVQSKPMNFSEIREAVRDFGLAAANAKSAGFDGVEIHGAHGYLLDQFLRDGTNKREDEYGGTVENRARFLFEVLDEVCSNWSPEHVGLRLSPKFNRPGFEDSNPEETFGYVVDKLNDYSLAYLHISEFGSPGFREDAAQNTLLPYYRDIYHGTLISCGNHTRKSAIETVEKGFADLVAFGKLFISNPDLVERLRVNAQLNEPDKETFYHGGPKGYTDYPFLVEQNKADKNPD